MKKLLVLAVFAAPLAHAGFTIEGSPIQSTNIGEMGRHEPTTDRGRAAFRAQSSELKTPQGRFSNSELMVDLAYTPLTQNGSGQATSVDGFGEEIPFADGMALIMPSGWQLYRSKSLSESEVPETISFVGGKSWPDVLKKIGEDEGLRFHLDWHQRSIEMMKGRTVHAIKRIKVIPEPAPVRAAAPVPQQPIAKTTPVTGQKALAAVPVSTIKSSPAPVDVRNVKATTPAPVAIAPPKPAAPVEVRLAVEPGYFSDNLIRLSKKHGWEVPEWRLGTTDFEIKSGYSVSGKTFTEAVTKLLMLHPVEAEVNTSTRKITVIKEAR